MTARPPCDAHQEPQPAAPAARARGGLSVRIPLRLVAGAQYADTALSVYVKIAALSQRSEGCTARVDTLAAYLGMSKSQVERGLADLRNPDAVDGVVEVPTTRRTLPGGRGQSAHRTTRPLAPGELWVRIPVRAAEALSPRLLRLYALLAYATARRFPVTCAELGEQMFHHTGRRAGEHLGERQARRLVDELEATGWLTVHRREGQHGRHAYETHRRPLHPVPAPATEAPAAEQLALWGAQSPDIHDGSGADLGDGSLASKEDLQTDRPASRDVVGIRRRRGTGSRPRAELASHVPPAFGPGHRVLRTDRTPGASAAAGRAPYTGPALQLSPRVWRVLEPLRHHLPELRPFVLRKIAREIGAQLGAGTGEERVRERLEHRYARTDTIRDIGRWILGAGLPRHGCGIAACESGTVWDAGQDCELCAVNRQVAAARRAAAQTAPPPAPAPVGKPPTSPGLLLVHDGPPPPPPAPLPPPADAARRAAATADDITTALARHGPADAIRIWGYLLVAPHLTPAATGS
ncbi:helix-turn-helix domain-containing protein [Streptomyces aureocirculatus]|uniref:helix-turn-helix domain-containing protein n=1 Tax=Streptomyces aureocirculatus TaxID=67275 RepID=UPI00068BB182|nr:helix-turn-helix domain-containing protein [Streptomyces aureocirculatus]